MAPVLQIFAPGGLSSSASFRFGIALQQNGAEAMYIAAHHHRQGDVALEAVDAVVRVHVQAVCLQGIDG
jgi:hypothetical protein